MADPLPSFMKDAIPVEEAPDAVPDFMAGAQPVEQVAPVKIDPQANQTALLDRLGAGATRQQIEDEFDTSKLPNIDEVIRYRDQHKGAVSKQVLELPRDEDGNILTRFVEGASRAPGQIVEGLAQLMIRGANAVGLVDDVDANMAQAKLAGDAEVRDAKYIRGTSGEVGKIAGDVASTVAVPLGRVAAGSKAVSTGLTVAKRALVGGALAGVSGASETASGQNTKAAIGAVTTPLMIPALEKVFAKVGGQVGNAYQRIAGNGVGKKLYDAQGNLTRYGAVLRARLRTVNSAIPDNLIDDTLKQVAANNPKTITSPANLVAETLSAKEGVPLTGAMKTRNAKGIQDFESMQTGAVGNEAGQAATIDRSKAIDDAIVGNVKSLGNGADTATSAANLGKAVSKDYDTAKAGVDRLYEPLNRTRIAAPKRIGEIANEARNEFGAGGYSTLGGNARGYIERINTIAETEKPLFGDLWKLSKDINEDLRKSVGSDKYQLGVIKKSIDNYFTKAAGDTTLPEVAARQLKLANKGYRTFSRTFGDNPIRANAGRTVIQDTPGKAVSKVIALTKDAAERGDDIPYGEIEKTILGSGKALDSAGAKNASRIITRLVKASPSTKPHVKNIVVNRIVGQMEQGMFEKSLKPEAAQTAIRQAVEGNRALLEASGFTSADITRLQTNAYLAALKIAPTGARARGSSATNRGVGGKVLAQGFRRALATAVGVGGFATGGTLGAALAYAAGEGALAVGSKVAAHRLAKRTLSSTVRQAADEAGTRYGRKVGAKVGAQSARDIAD